jgi:hypothetical protein
VQEGGDNGGRGKHPPPYSWVHRLPPPPRGRSVVLNWVRNFEQDIRVWENKINLPRPVLVKGDGPIMRSESVGSGCRLRER